MRLGLTTGALLVLSLGPLKELELGYQLDLTRVQATGTRSDYDWGRTTDLELVMVLGSCSGLPMDRLSATSKGVRLACVSGFATVRMMERPLVTD